MRSTTAVRRLWAYVDEFAAETGALVRRRRDRPRRRSPRVLFPGPVVRQSQAAVALRASALPLGYHVDLQGQPAAHAQRFDDVGLVRRGPRVAAAARGERDNARRRR